MAECVNQCLVLSQQVPSSSSSSRVEKHQTANGIYSTIQKVSFFSSQISSVKECLLTWGG